MKRFLHITLVLLLAIVVALSNSSAVLADGEEGEYILEAEVSGIHVSLANQKSFRQWRIGIGSRPVPGLQVKGKEAFSCLTLLNCMPA